MKRRLLLFFALFCVSVGTWATITITSASVSVGGTSVSGYAIEGAKAGELALLLSGDNSVTVQWNGATLDQLKSAEYVKVGSTSTPNILNNADLEALELLSGAKFLDIDGSVLAEGAVITNIKAGSAIEAVTLPNGLTKEQVNDVGAALASKANFGSCLSLVTEMEETQVTTYTYEDPCTSEKVEYTGEVTDGQGYIGDITRPLTFTSSSVTYVNTKFRNEVTPVSNVVENGYVVPNPLKVELTKLDTPKTIYQIEYNGQTLTVPSYAVNTSTNPPTVSQEFNCAETNWQNTEGLTGKELTVLTVEYTYTMRDWQAENPKDYFGTPLGDETNGYYAMVENVYSDQYGYRFEVTSSYNYTYTDPTDNCNETPISYTDGPHETIDIPYNQSVDLEATTITVNVPKEGGDCDVIAYVNTAGTLYKATSLDANDVASAKSVVISGNINNGDISWHGANSNDINYNDNDSFEPNGATVALVNWGTAPGSIDLSDAVIDDYRHLRVLRNFGKDLKRVVFPKTVTRIPNNCFVSSQGDGCYNLEEVVFPTEAEAFTIGDHAFQGTAIKSLLIPSAVTQVGDYAFTTCPKLTDVEMEGLKNACHFGNNVFEACKALKHVTLSEKVENIGDNQFKQCGLLESIRIPSTCETIGSNSFELCFSIHQITIPEGVRLIKEDAFENAGLTDIYVMATTPAMVPKIYAMAPNSSSSVLGVSTFSFQRTTGNNTVPQNHRSEIGSKEYDEVMSWYQEEQSGAEGLGTGNCLTALHYPESMKPFYEAFDVTQFYSEDDLADVVNWKKPAEYLDLLNDERRSYVEHELNNTLINGGTAYDFGNDEEGNPVLYQFIPQSYAVNPFGPTSHNDDPMGPDKNNMYYPNQHDYWVRLAAGATGTEPGGVNQGDLGLPVASQWGWRQFPLSTSIESIGETPFEKEYDDTWYTMCFPWKMEDNQLFMAFNQKCEIVEFKGAEMVKQDDENYNLVFHFDDVADTYYMDDNNVEYTRERDGDRVDAAGHKLYIYTNKTNPSDVVTCPEEVTNGNYNPKSADPAVKEAYGRYLSIQNIMVLPGHPYMIHPSIGAAPGSPATVYINGVKKIVPGEGLYEEFETLEAVAEANKVERKVAEISSTGEAVADVWKTPDGKDGGSYTFIGNINDEVIPEGATVGDGGKKDMPLPCYFLGVKSGTVYPKYYRRTSGGVKKWSQYSAIIVPDADAIANIENFMSTGSSSTGAKEMGDVVFGDWEIVDENQMATVIDNAIAEGEEKNEPAKIQHLNVVYNIKGQIVRSNSSSVEGLPKGLYIVNGKKYMVK